VSDAEVVTEAALFQAPAWEEVDAQVRADAPAVGHPRALLRGRGRVGLVLVAIVILVGALAPLLAPYGPKEQIRHAQLLGPSLQHLFGTDEVDRDVFSRTLYGIRIDLIVIFVAVPVGAFAGSLIGLVASQFTAADVLAQRLFDVLLAFPALIFAIGLAAVTGPGVLPVALVVIAVELPLYGRLMRTSALKVRELPFVEAAEVVGGSRLWTLRYHVIPNIAETIVVQLALSMSGAVFIESAMNFIGIGVRPPNPSLGSILADSIDYLSSNVMYAIGPLVFITVLVLGFLLIAQALAAARRSAS
jgi:peptide/nickel transport system permease protein